MSSKRKYRSKFEEGIGAVLEPEGAKYEPYKIPYWIPFNYTPDFVLNGVGLEILVECKGWFRPGDLKKYRAIRDDMPAFHELVFLLQRPNKKVRKGAQLTMAGWCEKEGIRWFSTPEEVLDYVHDNR